MAKTGSHGAGDWYWMTSKQLWRYRIYLNGRRREFYGKKKSDARAKADEARRAAEMGLATLDRRQTVGRYLAQWLETTKPPVSRPQTWIRNESAIRVHLTPAVGTVKLVALTPQHVQALYRELFDKGLAENTVVRIHAALNRALNQAVKWGLIPRNPVVGVDKPKAKRVVRAVLTPGDGWRLVEEASSPVFRALYTVALTAGLRRGELLALTWDDVNLDRRSIAVRRTKVRVAGGGFHTGEPKSWAGRRTIPVIAATVAELRRWRAEQLEARLKAGRAWEELGLVFTTALGTPLNESNVQRTWKRDRERIGFPSLHLHDLRHSFATIAIEQGAPMKGLQSVLGHSDIRTTMNTYVHSTPELEAAVAASLGRAFAMH